MKQPNGSGGALRFAGYAAIFDHIDRGGDIVRKGAFSQTLKCNPRSVPLLWQHDPARPIGRIEYLKEDERGLRVIAKLSEGSSGKEAAALLRDGATMGLSFGYRVRESSGEKPRELLSLDLVEVSLVTFPMQPKARVHAIAA